MPVRPGVPLSRPQPLFAKLDPSVIDEELARLEKS
jgi:methionyl-tRNA synthetase